MITLADMDTRCLDFDHSFPWMDAYDEDGEPRGDQMGMVCFRCGETLRHSFQRMTAALKSMIDSGGPA